MDRGAWQAPWSCKRVGPDLVIKQQQGPPDQSNVNVDPQSPANPDGQ